MKCEKVKWNQHKTAERFGPFAVPLCEKLSTAQTKAGNSRKQTLHSGKPAFWKIVPERIKKLSEMRPKNRRSRTSWATIQNASIQWYGRRINRLQCITTLSMIRRSASNLVANGDCASGMQDGTTRTTCTAERFGWGRKSLAPKTANDGKRKTKKPNGKKMK